jgi:hypothetical protein
MRQETNNEMDLLLRRVGRRGDGGVRDGETGDRHLDADELSSYAQNVLPAPARARYMEHLADCASCRKMVTELSLALGAAAAPVETVVAPSGLKAFLASLLSPMVLRYAVPALGVVLVMVIGFVAFRRTQQERFVAQLDQKRSVSETVQPGLVAPTPAAPAADGNTVALPKAENQQPPAVQHESRKRDEDVVAGAAPGGAAGGASSAPVTKATDEIARNETRPAVAAAEPPPAAPKAVAESEESKQTDKEKKAEAQAKKQPESTDISTDGAIANAKKTAANASPTERRISSLPVQNRGFGDVQTVRPAARARDEKREDKDATENRSVAGRNFKKERGIWIDSAYDSSTRTVNLARGSEQFRALVADEPAIKTIAEQLDGEVIVVWKGRAYHIR